MKDNLDEEERKDVHNNENELYPVAKAKYMSL